MKEPIKNNITVDEAGNVFVNDIPYGNKITKTFANAAELSDLDKTQNALNEAKKDIAKVDVYKQQITDLQRDIAGKTGRITVLEQQLKASGKTTNPAGAVVLDPTGLNAKGKKKFDNSIKPVFGILRNKDYQK